MKADNDNNLFTPATLAKAWGCSERHVRNLLNEGEIEHFKLGKKLIRIPAAAVEDYQCRMTSRTRSGGTADSSALSSRTPTETAGDILFAVQTDQLLKRRRQAFTQK